MPIERSEESRLVEQHLISAILRSALLRIPDGDAFKPMLNQRGHGLERDQLVPGGFRSTVPRFRKVRDSRPRLRQRQVRQAFVREARRVARQLPHLPEKRPA